MRVLVAEDDPENREILRRLLRRLGAEVSTVRDGVDALESFQGGAAFDIVFLDLGMPGMDGFAAANGMRTTEAERGWPHTPIVALSGADDDPSIAEAGFDGFMQKPIDSASLKAALVRWTGKEGPESLR